jgi:formate hydrogenlyase subunit 3/multisubunit Na+/H+ antiporter MnhD subunit
MILVIVGIILILFAIYLILTFLSYTSLFLNLIILIALFFLISKDLKDKDNHKYYLASLLLTAILFIFSATTLNLLVLTEKMLLSPAIVAVIGVYVFANLIAFIYESFHYIKQKYRK